MDVHPPNPALDATLIILAELHRAGTVDDKVLAGIIEKLEFAEYHDIADRVAALPLMNLIGDPKRR